MSRSYADSLSDRSMEELFRMEVETQASTLTDGLLAFERDPTGMEKLQDLMRAAHSLKGAAQIVGRQSAAKIAHAMEDCLVAAQNRTLQLTQRHIDVMLDGVDLLSYISKIADSEFELWQAEHQKDIDLFLTRLLAASETNNENDVPSVTSGPEVPMPRDRSIISRKEELRSQEHSPDRTENSVRSPSPVSERVLRITADNLDRLLGLAGEARVASRWLDEFVAKSASIRQAQRGLMQSYDRVSESLAMLALHSSGAAALNELHDRIVSLQNALSERFAGLERFDRRFMNLSSRLYQEVLNCRMRPFSDGVKAFPRMARDLAHSLGKTVRLDVIGESTPVDRDILERLQAPFDHLLRNAIDHGIESADERRPKGKPEDGLIEMEARHSAGMLVITIRDDGRGIDPEAIRRSVIKKKLASDEIARKMSETELFEFLFLPGFTLKETISEISGRGVGLDVVQAMTKQVGGSVRVSASQNHGTCFTLELPLTLSLIRTLVVEIGGEPYAFPLARIDTVLKIPHQKIQSLEGRQYFNLGEQQIGLVAATQILELKSQVPDEDVCVVVLGRKSDRYGVVVDRFLNEQELVVRPLDPRLGKIKNISAASLMPDGSPVLIVDVDDLVLEIGNTVSGRQISQLEQSGIGERTTERKRVLVVDDSLTVRELERKLLVGRGYTVDVAVDGVDGWNAARTGNYDLIVTDVDMPRMDGIELVRLIRKDNRLKALPIMIVSYKDRQEDKDRGLEAGADYYLTKGSFQDDTLIRAVTDLIGSPQA